MNKYILIPLILLGVTLANGAYKKTRPDPDLLRFEARGALAYGYGYTDDRSIGQVARFIGDHPELETLVLKSMSGTHNSIANLRIARNIRKQGLATHLEADSHIASGAVDLFLSGARRTMECGAKIGVHSWSTDFGQSGQDDWPDSFQRTHERYLSDMGIDPSFYAFTRAAAPPEGIYWLTMADIKRFDLLTHYPDCD